MSVALTHSLLIHELLAKMGFVLQFCELLFVGFPLSSVVVHSVEHAAFVAALVVALVGVEGFKLLLLGGVSHLGPDVDWHQLLGLEVRRLQASAHG